jgi:CRP-like cAMP-binding protein
MMSHMPATGAAVLPLKSISLFTDTPEHVLAEVAAVIHTQNVTTGDLICQKGDPGNRLYISRRSRARTRRWTHARHSRQGRRFRRDTG